MSEYEKRRLAFGDALRQVREAAGLSGKQLAGHAGWAPSKVSRIETAKQSVSDADVLTYCEVTGASDETAAELRQELREIRLEAASWKSQLRTGHRARQEYSDQLERRAARIRMFETALVPGLVQTAEYARHVFDSEAAKLGGGAWGAATPIRSRRAADDFRVPSGYAHALRTSVVPVASGQGGRRRGGRGLARGRCR